MSLSLLADQEFNLFNRDVGDFKKYIIKDY